MSKQNIFLKFISACFSLLLAAVLIASVPLWIINHMISEDSIDTIADYVFVDVSNIGFNTTEGSITVSRLLLLSIKDCAGANYITEKQMNKALVPDFLKTVTLEVIEDFNDQSEIRISADDIYDYLQENEDELSSLANDSGYRQGIDIKGNKQSIISNIKDLLGKKGITLNTVLDDEIADTIEEYLEYAQLVLLETAANISYCAIAIIGIILFVINLGYFKHFLTACGNPAILIGTLYFISAIVVQAVAATIDLPSGGLGAAIDFLFGYTAAVIMDFSAPVFLVGLAMLILSLFVRKKHNE